jgi:hypothetical protein
MNDDIWLRELIQMERERRDAEQAKLDERWDRLSAGELSPEEEAVLRQLAETTDEGHQAYEAFRPLGPEFQARVVGAIREQSVAETPKRSPIAPKPPVRLLQFRGRPAAVGGWLTAAAAVAAGLLLFLPGAQPPLPGYRLGAFSGGAMAMRGEPAEASRSFPPGSRFVLVATPDTAVPGEIAVECFLARGPELLPLETPAPILKDGAVRIAGTVGRDVVIPPGEWTLWVVVGRPAKLPDAAELRAHLGRSPPRTPDWVALNARLKAG